MDPRDSRMLVVGLCLACLFASTAMADPPDYFMTVDPDSFAYIYENWELDYWIPCVISRFTNFTMGASSTISSQAAATPGE